CDVDAANLHLLIKHKTIKTSIFKAGKKAVINEVKCISCGKCREACRFGAVKNDGVFRIDPLLCEGCGLCSRICPHEAVVMNENAAGLWYVSESEYGPFVHAKLGIAEDNSGKLAAKVREEAKREADKNRIGLVIIDGPPGTGCPVMASITGVDLAVIVTEPTVSGIHDLERVRDVASHFGIKVCVIVNKYDINKEKTGEIINFCGRNGIYYAGSVSFSGSILDSVMKGIPPVLGGNKEVKNEINEIWKGIKTHFLEGG
ncbi:MAG TPA: (4Fe-4S)-binding protein, partial [Firmicutes bacterium]|nr:(4Fe-4S)-binding protein [Bacillota bacterium]